MKKTFGSITFDYDDKVKIEDHFETVYEDAGRLVMLSKQQFQHREEDLNFDYRYVVYVTDLNEFSNEKGAIAELYLVVNPSSMNKENRDSVADCYCWGENDEELDAEWHFMDLACEYGVKMEEETIETDEEDLYSPSECKEVQIALKSICQLYQSTDSLRGFYLDRAWNMVGSTGWDTIKSAVHGGDAIQRVLDRYKND